MARHFEGYRRKHSDRVAKDGPRPEVELETHERFVSLHEQGRLRADWNDTNFRNYVADHQVPVIEGTPEYDTLKAEHGKASVEYRRWLVDFDRQTVDARWPPKADTGHATEVQTKPPSTPSRTTLKELADAWLEFASTRWRGATGQERRAHLAYLFELIPSDTAAADVTAEQAREVRHLLQRTPVNRKKLIATRELSLREQVKVEGIKKLDHRTIMKQLGVYRLCSLGQ
jgi:hypothetical protein